jgi:hypothetical protein
MQSFVPKVPLTRPEKHRYAALSSGCRQTALAALAAVVLGLAVNKASGADPSEPILDLLLQKGIVTQEEVDKARAQAEALRSNALAEAMPPIESKWKISDAIKSVELFGDVRVRYEHRQANAPDGRVELDRGRFALRVGLRGDAFDDFYYGLRLDTAANPRSPWVTFGTSSSGIPYNGPYGKSTSGINVGEAYIGWHPEPWVDLTVGKMPMPLYTTPMVWDPDLTPEGAAEQFKYTVGEAQFYATFGQFLYQDTNPNYASGGFGFNGLLGQQSDDVFQLAWQVGMNYHLASNVSAKVAATLYQYIGLQTNVSPFFGDPYIGEGAFTGPGTANPINGASGYGSSSSILGQGSLGFPNNQVGLNNLLVLEVPFELNFKIRSLHARLFADFAYNFEGGARARDAANAYAQYLAVQSATGPVTVSPFPAQQNENKAYQFGFGIGSGGLSYGPAQGLVYGTTSRKHAWELRTYWQHVEQYALDPNLMDSDFFEGRANLEGIFAALAYGFTDNTIGTVRYGYAKRINDALGTGGANQDIPQVNPIDHYSILQLDLTLRF